MAVVETLARDVEVVDEVVLVVSVVLVVAGTRWVVEEEFDAVLAVVAVVAPPQADNVTAIRAIAKDDGLIFIDAPNYCLSMVIQGCILVVSLLCHLLRDLGTSLRPILQRSFKSPSFPRTLQISRLSKLDEGLTLTVSISCFKEEIIYYLIPQLGRRHK